MTVNGAEPHSSNPHRSRLSAWFVALLAASVGVTAIVVSIAVARAAGSQAITNPQILSGVIVCVGTWLVTAMVKLAGRIEEKIEATGDRLREEVAEYGRRERSEGHISALINTKVNGSNGTGLYPVR